MAAADAWRRIRRAENQGVIPDHKAAGFTRPSYWAPRSNEEHYFGICFEDLLGGGRLALLESPELASDRE